MVDAYKSNGYVRWHVEINNHKNFWPQKVYSPLCGNDVWKALWTLVKLQVISGSQAWNCTIKYKAQFPQKKRRTNKYQQHHLVDALLRISLVSHDYNQPTLSSYSTTHYTLFKCPVCTPSTQQGIKLTSHRPTHQSSRSNHRDSTPGGRQTKKIKT